MLSVQREQPAYLGHLSELWRCKYGIYKRELKEGKERIEEGKFQQLDSQVLPGYSFLNSRFPAAEDVCFETVSVVGGFVF